MKRLGPIHTLLAGVALVLALGVLTSRAAREPAPAQAGGGRSPAPAPTVTATSTATPSPAGTAAPAPTPAPVPERVDFAGRASRTRAVVALSIRDGKAIAYVCDGRRTEAWLRGTVEDGLLALSSPAGARITGSVGEGEATGAVILRTGRFGFTAPAVTAPSGLYRATAVVRGARVRGGWIVLPDGTQVGVLNRGGRPAPAPELDPASRTAVVDGVTVTAEPVSGGGGF
ncbi:hypothetical protein [Bailinhaonella thermotolerans]|uniref:Serine/threonine protein kinase n=1 Tax=Bailinhaonella thermotolerans TaxID=1070861 RepID=A0A3A4B600_9ACTN|nr:hypothetical protein [Bailinhaonella thermotolerans]RJL33471.1 hypothetical protein D5H75_11870 [Bailinhaonella thermotolerans]